MLIFQAKRDRAPAKANWPLGDLTIHGVTREVVFSGGRPDPAGRTPGATPRGASATAKINRRDFGLTWNAALETGGVLVGDEIKITLDVQFIKA